MVRSGVIRPRTDSAEMSRGLVEVHVVRSSGDCTRTLTRVRDRARRPKCQRCHRRIGGLLRNVPNDLQGSSGGFLMTMQVTLTAVDWLRVAMDTFHPPGRAGVCLSQGADRAAPRLQRATTIGPRMRSESIRRDRRTERDRVPLTAKS